MRFPKIARVQEFVRWEEEQTDRYEFADGAASPYPGASLRHELIVVSVIFALRQRLGPGRVRGSSLKQLTNVSSRYPDVPVVDGSLAFQSVGLRLAFDDIFAGTKR